MSPYGNPVPGLDDLGVTAAEPRNQDEVPIFQIISDRVVAGVVTRIGETPQAEPAFLADLAQIGVLPGKSVEVVRGERGVEITAEHGSITVTEDDAKHLFIHLD